MKKLLVLIFITFIAINLSSCEKQKKGELTEKNNSQDYINDKYEKIYNYFLKTVSKYYVTIKGKNDKIKESKKLINDVLGVDKNEFIKIISNNNIDNLFVFESLADDIKDGYLDSKIDLFKNAKRRKLQKVKFELPRQIINDKNHIYKIIGVHDKQEHNLNEKVGTLGYLSDVLLFEEDKDGKNLGIIYHSFYVGKLKNKLNSDTQVMYDIFMNTPFKLSNIAISDLENITNNLLSDKIFKKASSIYNKMLKDKNSSYEYEYEAIINYISNDLNKKYFNN